MAARRKSGNADANCLAGLREKTLPAPAINAKYTRKKISRGKYFPRLVELFENFRKVLAFCLAKLNVRVVA